MPQASGQTGGHARPGTGRVTVTCHAPAPHVGGEEPCAGMRVQSPFTALLRNLQELRQPWFPVW